MHHVAVCLVKPMQISAGRFYIWSHLSFSDAALWSASTLGNCHNMVMAAEGCDWKAPRQQSGLGCLQK
jgi:hypothetical protein